MHLVQQRWQPLYLVHDHPVAGVEMLNGLREQRRVCQQVLEQALVKEV